MPRQFIEIRVARLPGWHGTGRAGLADTAEPASRRLAVERGAGYALLRPQRPFAAPAAPAAPDPRARARLVGRRGAAGRRPRPPPIVPRPPPPTLRRPQRPPPPPAPDPTPDIRARTRLVGPGGHGPGRRGDGRFHPAGRVARW